MDIPSREQLERRMSALVADHLDQIAEANPEGFDLGIIALAVEVVFPDPESTLIRREEGGYSPSPDVNSYQSTLCTDHRWWVTKAFFQEAYEYYAYPRSGENVEEDGEEGGAESL